MKVDSTQRFTSRVGVYARHRPDYPQELIGLIARQTGLTPEWVVADVGAGTGLSARLFLENGNTVYAVEPNAAMRGAAAEAFRDEPRFLPVDGTAEATGLPPHSVDLVIAAQAFHWFDPEGARAEVGRILRGPGWVVLAWNTRSTEASPFLRAYEELLFRYGTDYGAVRHDRIDPRRLAAFFDGNYDRHALANQQSLDREGLRGRLVSSSYVPGPGEPLHQPMLDELDRLFDEHQENGAVAMLYDLEVYIGRIEGNSS